MRRVLFIFAEKEKKVGRGGEEKRKTRDTETETHRESKHALGSLILEMTQALKTINEIATGKT